jgi:hypothetical protein
MLMVTLLGLIRHAGDEINFIYSRVNHQPLPLSNHSVEERLWRRYTRGSGDIMLSPIVRNYW